MLGSFSKDKIDGNKKMVENLVLILVLFIIVIVVINSLGEDKNEIAQSNSSNTNINNIINQKEKSQEEKLEEILSLVEGAGKVDVLITYSNGIEQVPMYSTKQSTTTVQETDKSGGTRKTEEINNEQSVIYNEEGNSKVPMIKQTINPKVIGVIVVSDGASSLNVKENIMKAVEATLDVPAHRVQVFARKKWWEFVEKGYVENEH